MSNPLSKKRRQAFAAQAGRCCYCGFRMWLENQAEFARALGLRPTAVQVLQCTAEHLHARQQGGTDRAGNIAAACWACNKRRHARGGTAMDPETFRRYVQRRIAKRRWHPQHLFRSELRLPDSTRG